jgi:hypothetical protein
MSDPQCEGCGKRPEVYGSCWCANCAHTIPRGAQERILTLRNALIDIAVIRGLTKPAMRVKASQALRIVGCSTCDAAGDAK